MPEKKPHTSSEVKRRYNSKAYGTVTVYADKELVAEFKELCKEKGISQAQVLKQAMQDFIDSNK